MANTILTESGLTILIGILLHEGMKAFLKALLLSQHAGVSLEPVPIRRHRQAVKGFRHFVLAFPTSEPPNENGKHQQKDIGSHP